MPGRLSRRGMLVASGMVALAAMPAPARGQAWPSQSIRLIVPFAPGGTTDLVARLVATPLGERLGTSIVIENRAGAGATVGSEMAARAAPDGHTLLMSNIASHGIGPTLYRNLRYDAVRDFAHIALIVSNPSVFVANPRAGIASLADLARLHRAAPRGIDMASSGAGSSNHMLIVQMGQLLGKEINHVPFRGAGPAMTAVIAGQVPLMSDSLPSSVAHLRQGSVVPVAMSSAARHPAFPQVPTFREQGYDLVSTTWFGLSAPAGTPQPVVERLNREVRAILGTAEMAARFAELGGTPGDLDAGGYARFVAAEVARWAPIVQASGATPD
ncbi:MAG TPA: tripartite tricarboxylate transporter substrate binding protein [Acetobacteraceae bacterium]|nr:tripartite tricarboxylate transporter substrate binding protein [Acetobacteraceae bacterium]